MIYIYSVSVVLVAAQAPNQYPQIVSQHPLAPTREKWRKVRSWWQMPTAKFSNWKRRDVESDVGRPCWRLISQRGFESHRILHLQSTSGMTSPPWSQVKAQLQGELKSKDEQLQKQAACMGTAG